MSFPAKEKNSLTPNRWVLEITRQPDGLLLLVSRSVWQREPPRDNTQIMPQSASYSEWVFASTEGMLEQLVTSLISNTAISRQAVLSTAAKLMEMYGGQESPSQLPAGAPTPEAPSPHAPLSTTTSGV
jgi:hypothetical protein